MGIRSIPEEVKIASSSYKDIWDEILLNLLYSICDSAVNAGFTRKTALNNQPLLTCNKISKSKHTKIPIRQSALF